MDKKENTDASEKMKEVLNSMSKKLDMQMNGEVVNDTMLRHIKKSMGSLANDKSLLEMIARPECDEMMSEWTLFMFAVTRAGPLPEEEMTEDVKKGLNKFMKKNGLKSEIDKTSKG